MAGLARVRWAGCLAALAAPAAIAASDGWRTAILAIVAGGAVVASRIRYASQAAVVVLVAAALLALMGHGVNADQRPGKREGPAPTARSR